MGTVSPSAAVHAQGMTLEGCEQLRTQTFKSQKDGSGCLDLSEFATTC